MGWKLSLQIVLLFLAAIPAGSFFDPSAYGEVRKGAAMVGGLLLVAFLAIGVLAP